MTSKTVPLHRMASSFLLIAVIGVCCLWAAPPAAAQNGQAASSAAAIDVRGTWSGSFYPKHANVTPFTMTIVIDQDDQGALIGSSSLSSDCMKTVRLKVTVTGSKVVLAGSNEEGHNITLRGTLDKTGTQLKSTYIMNGSSTGNCETDGGLGTLVKR